MEKWIDRLKWLLHILEKNKRASLYSAAGVVTLLTMIAAFASPAGAWPLAAIAVAFVFAANIDLFSEFSASSTGITAKVREAKGALTDLKRIIEAIASAELHHLQSAGRWGGSRDEDKKRIYDSIVKLMIDAGVSGERIKEIKAESWDRYVIWDYVVAITGGNYIPKDPKLEAEWRDFRKDFDNPPSPSKLADFLARHGDGNEARQRLLESYESYYATGEHLSEEVWRSRDEVPQIGLQPIQEAPSK